MAKQIYILSYVIAIILILSNVKIVSANKNNQYATSTTTTAFATAFADGTDDPVAVSSATQQSHTTAANALPMSTVRSVETKSISALHDGIEFMQQTLHNTSSTIDEESKQSNDQKEVHKQVKRPLSSGNHADRKHEYLVQQDDGENPKQLLSTMQPLLSMYDLQQPNPNGKRHNHAQQRIDQHSATPFTYHDKFMNENENKKTVNAIESNTATTTAQMRIASSTEHNRPTKRINSGQSNDDNVNNNNNNNDSRQTDEITSMPMKNVRDNVNATSDTVFRVNDESVGVTNVNKTLAIDKGNLSTDDTDNDGGVGSFSLEDPSDLKFNERSRYLETDLDDFSLPEANVEQTDVNVNDQLAWPDDASEFEELTLDDDDGIKSTVNMQARSWTQDSPSVESAHEAESISPSPISTHNILKISKPNKSKSMKRLAAAPPPHLPQALLEIRLNKSPPLSTANEKQFINSHSFRYISNLYNQYEWDANDLRNVLSPRCASDMYVYLDALVKGKIWAAKGKMSTISNRIM